MRAPADAGAITDVARATAEAELVGLLLPEVRRFLARDVHPEAIERDGIPRSVREEAGRLGLFGLTIPTEYGGAGLSLASACQIIEEIARVDRSVAIMIGLHSGLGIRGLVDHGTPALRERYLPRLASGEWIASFAATEAGAGSDLTSIRTTGKVVGGELRVTGTKSYVTNGGFASVFTLLIRTPGLGGARAHSLVAIPRDAPGVEIGAEEDKLGIRGSSTVEVRFDGVRVPLENVLGTPGGGMAHAHDLLGWGRTLMSAGCVGTARAALDAACRYVAERRQFGRAIGDFAATRAHVAWMAARVHAMRALVVRAAEVFARGESIEVASAEAKVFSSDGAFEVCDRALQLHGAMGFLEPTGVARMLRDCRITRIFEGANDVLLVRLGAARLVARAEARPPIARADELRDVAAGVDVLEARIAHEVAALRAARGIAATRDQLGLQRLARAQIAASAASASLATADDADLSRYAASTLLREGHRALAELGSSVDDGARAFAVSENVYARATGGGVVNSTSWPRAPAPIAPPPATA